ncbi:MAG: hypothetical protein ACJ73J_02840 [Actinomycetes bacterium]
MSELRRPPGWPPGVPPPGADDWREWAVAFLLDVAPAEFRVDPFYRRQPVVLAWRVQTIIEAQLDAARTSYSQARADLRDEVTPEVVAETLQALEREGAGLLARRREVELVSRALRGEQFVPRL